MCTVLSCVLHCITCGWYFNPLYTCRTDSEPVTSNFLPILRAHKTNKLTGFHFLRPMCIIVKLSGAGNTHRQTQKKKKKSLAGFALLRVPGKSGSVRAPPSPPCGFNSNCAIQTWPCGETGDGGGELVVEGLISEPWESFVSKAPWQKSSWSSWKQNAGIFRGFALITKTYPDLKPG